MGTHPRAFMELAQASPFYEHMKIPVEKIDEAGARVTMTVATKHMNLIGLNGQRTNGYSAL